MPKENTHLWFARSLIGPSATVGVAHYARNEPLFFFLGSIIPDAFSYHFRPRVLRMARVLHGSDPRWAGRAPAHLVRLAGETGTPRDKAFVLGFLSHLALDQVFHPVIHVLSGKRTGAALTQEIPARHRLVETALDRIVNRSVFYPRVIRPRIGDRVVPLQSLCSDVGLRPEDARQALSIQLLANRLILGRGAHVVLEALNRIPFLDLSVLRNLCYVQLEREPAFAAPQTITEGSRDHATDSALRAVRRIKWSRLFARSRGDALAMFRVCSAFWRGEAPGSALEEALPRNACN